MGWHQSQPQNADGKSFLAELELSCLQLAL